MWILIRVVLAIIGFAVRQRRARRAPRGDGMHDGVPYALIKHTRKGGGVVSIDLGMPLAAPTWIRMHGESSFDRWMKRLGVANEQPTGDPAFDHAVYVTCDHPAVARLLAASSALRDAIRAGLALGTQTIRFDGRTVWFEQITTSSLEPRHLEALVAVQRASQPLTTAASHRLADPFLWKALLVEGVVWAIAGYGIGAAIEMWLDRPDVHVWPGAVVARGLIVAAVAFLGLVAVIGLWMRGSSRGHRIIAESAFVLLLGLPIGSIQAVGDSNRAFDDGASIVIDRPVEHCEHREHRGKRGRRWYTYHVVLGAPPEQPAAEPAAVRLPASIETTQAVCDAAHYSRALRLHIGPGRWGLPWYRRLEAGTEAWSPR